MFTFKKIVIDTIQGKNIMGSLWPTLTVWQVWVSQCHFKGKRAPSTESLMMTWFMLSTGRTRPNTRCLDRHFTKGVLRHRI